METALVTTYILPFQNITISQISQVGGKNAALGEMFTALAGKGVLVPDGFATTTQAYYDFLEYNHLYEKIHQALTQLDTNEYSNLAQTGEYIRNLILSGQLPPSLQSEIRIAFRNLQGKYTHPIQVAVRSSATAEDLPHASFAGQHESFLNITDEEQLLRSCLRCYASLFKDRAIKYRYDHGFDSMKVALSIGIQKMVRSDLSSSGVCFTLEPDSGFRDVILITGCWGLGENIVQGAVNPDEFMVFKPTLEQNKQAILSKKLGSKSITMIYAQNQSAELHDGSELHTGSEAEQQIESSVVNIETPVEKRNMFVLSDQEIKQLAVWGQIIENHYGHPMDIEWAKDGLDGKIYIVQARPETVFSQQKQQLILTEYTLKQKGKLLANGKSIGNRIISGTARIIDSPQDAAVRELKAGDILITDITNPDWDPILKKVSAIVTNRGGRTSHAAIVAREMGALAVVGTTNATENIADGSLVTVVCTDEQNGQVYEGALEWTEKSTNLSQIDKPQTKAMFILADPDQAFRLSLYPNEGVGLLRLEFIINNSIGIHPMALAHFDSLSDKEKSQIEQATRGYQDKKQFFVDKLSEAVATVAAAFYPKLVIVRMSDFKTNEYANLIGGKTFEPIEENPMLGFRGASRYYDPRYTDGFALECLAIKKVRDQMGLINVKVMIPFCRTIQEGKKVLDRMQSYGLERGKNNLQVYVMAEIPSNILLAKDFAQIFDGFSIGSNDLTQLTLGIDRDSSSTSELFNENDPAVLELIELLITVAHRMGKPVGICGQAPSDLPEFTHFLIENGIDSISFNPDAFLKGLLTVNQTEQSMSINQHYQS
ncbi:phosphoenolpyruvate synthase [Xanthocytophaga agilis]|uniref:Phosphoenolpyruvate synthase n=1 Tax=Xanthocytophaga agilis TaxID=3048010 RepID=A0AAE3R2U9_9BACT|nr:phosphoenolpyruvate synthase [Xanthocytophaga agilis]MDJ1500320.1 phosphoenolpyruvate synthase [Xanthocytophaga agilis]